jgi:hypothetical protein
MVNGAIKENQIARLKIASSYISADLRLLFRRTRQIDAVLPIDVLGEGRTIEIIRLSGGSAVFVRRTDIFFTGSDNLLRQGGRRDGSGVRVHGCCRHGYGSRSQQREGHDRTSYQIPNTMVVHLSSSCLRVSIGVQCLLPPYHMKIRRHFPAIAEPQAALGFVNDYENFIRKLMLTRCESLIYPTIEASPLSRILV